MKPAVRRVVLALAVIVTVLVAVIEIASRVADGIVEKRTSAPGYKPPKENESDLVEKISLRMLEYGEIKRSLEQDTNARSEPHPYLSYAPKKSWRTAPSATKQATHNSLGFRGKETTWAKPPGVFRIVTSGGSSVYGQSETRDEAVWSQRLEDHLNAARPSQKFEVVNTGVMGWSSFEMLINLELRALDLEPDLVIVYEAINDMRCALHKRGGPVTRDNLHWRAVWPVDRPSTLERWLGHSRTYLVWRRYLTDYAKERADLGFYAITNYDPEAKDMYVEYEDGKLPELGFTNYRRNLDQIIAVCKARNARVLIATQALPRWHLDPADSRAEQLEGFDRIQNIQRELAAARGVPLFECARIVEAAVQAELDAEIARQRELLHDPSGDKPVAEARRIVRMQGLFFSEVHPNDSGSELIAKSIADYLLGSELLPR